MTHILYDISKCHLLRNVSKVHLYMRIYCGVISRIVMKFKLKPGNENIIHVFNFLKKKNGTEFYV